MRKIAVLLCGCGSLDGSEIFEVCATILAISKYKIEADYFAKDQNQVDVINHSSKILIKEKRNILEESNRITRGNTRDLSLMNPLDYEALIIPGGFGVAKNYMNYAVEGKRAIIDESIKDIIRAFYSHEKYIGAICIAPILVALAIKDLKKDFMLTVGFDKKANEDLRFFGACPKQKESYEICLDKTNKLVSTPAYMNSSANHVDIYSGIDKLVKIIADNCV